LGKLRELSTTLEDWICPKTLREEIRGAMEEEKEQTKARFDKHRHDHIRYTVGEVLVLSRTPVHTGESTKLQEKYKGPLVVTEVLPGDAQLGEGARRHFTTCEPTEVVEDSTGGRGGIRRRQGGQGKDPKGGQGAKTVPRLSNVLVRRNIFFFICNYYKQLF